MDESTKIIEALQVRASELMRDNAALRERAAIAEKQLAKVDSLFMVSDTAMTQLELIVGRDSVSAAIRIAYEILGRGSKSKKEAPNVRE